MTFTLTTARRASQSLAHFQPQFAALGSWTRSHGEPDYPTRNSPAKAVLLGPAGGGWGDLRQTRVTGTRWWNE
jgi:hypothetical protein